MDYFQKWLGNFGPLCKHVVHTVYEWQWHPDILLLIINDLRTKEHQNILITRE